MLVYWARLIADGHLRNATQARADLARYNSLVAEVRRGKNAYLVDGTGSRIMQSEVLAWTAFAEGKQADSLPRCALPPTSRTKLARAKSTFPRARCSPTCCSNMAIRSKPSPSTK